MSAPLTARLFSSVVLRKDDGFLVLNELDDDGIKILNLPGGHVEPGENPFQAAKREAKEETGFEVELGKLIALRFNVWSETHSVQLYFSASAYSGELILEPNVTAHWMTRQQIETTEASLFKTGVQQVLLCAADNLSIPSETVLFFQNKIRQTW